MKTAILIEQSHAPDALLIRRVAVKSVNTQHRRALVTFRLNGFQHVRLATFDQLASDEGRAADLITAKLKNLPPCDEKSAAGKVAGAHDGNL